MLSAKPQEVDIAIVGGGAAGLMAGIFAGRSASGDEAVVTSARSPTPASPAFCATPRRRIVILDGATRIGAKILVSGGGRCNVTHEVVNPNDFAGNRNQIARVLRSFDVPATIAFFRDIGVELKTEETGKLFPVTDRAATVLEGLLEALRSAGVELRLQHCVLGIEPDGAPGDARRLAVITPQGRINARRVILATGGQSLPKTGSDGAGYLLAKALGHTVTPTFPALVPLLLPKDHHLTTMSGISFEAQLAVRAASGKVLARQDGSVLLTHFGISGPAVLDISRHWIAARAADPAATLTANLMAPDDFQTVDARLLAHAQRNPTAKVFTTLAAVLVNRLADQLPRQIEIDPGMQLAQLSKANRQALARLLTELPLPVVGDRGFTFAEVTAGGVPLGEVDTATMASRRCPGVHLCGEILDVDGRVGGYNFQWAWCTGRLAGIAAAQGL